MRQGKIRLACENTFGAGLKAADATERNVRMDGAGAGKPRPAIVVGSPHKAIRAGRDNSNHMPSHAGAPYNDH